MSDWNKEFVVTSITRVDLQEAGFPDEHISQLTDEDMVAIASKMEDMYCEESFWEHLELAANKFL